jgi:protein subunit release factor A
MLCIEIRPGEGGDDAVAFAHQLADTVVAWARHLGHPADRSTDSTRQVIIEVRGPIGPYEQLAGVHRIQRVPTNDRRRHTSTATVAVLPQAA